MTRDPSAALGREVRRRGLVEPARLLLEAHRPISPILADGATFLRPLLEVLGPSARQAGELLAERDGLDRLLAGLDAADRSDPSDRSDRADGDLDEA